MAYQKSSAAYDELESDKERRRALFFSKFVGYIPLIGLAAIIGLYFISLAVTGYRFSIQLEVIVNNIILVAFVATGASFIFAIGSFDLSLGANMLLCAIVGSLVYTRTGSLILMIAVCVALATAISLVNYLLASVFNLPVFIMTVAMMTVLSTISNFIVGRNTIYLKFSNSSNPDKEIYTNVLDTVPFCSSWSLCSCLLLYFLFYKDRKRTEISRRKSGLCQAIGNIFCQACVYFFYDGGNRDRTCSVLRNTADRVSNFIDGFVCGYEYAYCYCFRRNGSFRRT